MKKKTIALVLALVLIVGAAIGGTVAYLTDKSAAVTNTFTIGKVDIDLTETTGASYKMIPGNTIAKNPKVTVTANSEDSWVFVKVVANNVSDYLEYSIDSGWTALPNVDGVYYREYTSSTAAVDYPVLTNNQVKVKSDVTNAMMESASTNAPTLTFTAYAIQKANVGDVSAAWAKVSTLG